MEIMRARYRIRAVLPMWRRWGPRHRHITHVLGITCRDFASRHAPEEAKVLRGWWPLLMDSNWRKGAK